MDDNIENTEEVVDTPVEQPNVMDMSDAEFLAYEESGSVVETSEAVEAPVTEPEEVLDETETNTPEEEENPSEDPSEVPTVEINKEEAYDQIMGEFKANGKMMKVDSVEEAQRLMQMGANYHKKMNERKEDQKFIRVLKDNGLLDQGKLNHLIDLSKNDPAAIKELLKNSGTDPLDMDMDEDSEYTPNTYEVNEAQVQLDETLESMQGSPSYATTMDIISNKWDSTSRVALASHPEDITVLNQQVESGIYQKVMDAVDKERMLGGLSGVSDFEAYKQIGSKIYATEQSAPANEPKKRVEIEVDKPNAVANEKRRAAAPTKTQPTVTKQTGVKKNPLSMSDEEFEKAFG